MMKNYRLLTQGFGHDGEMNGDFYRVVQGGPDCPYLEEARCPLLLPPLVVAGQVAPRGAAVAADVEPGRREGVAPRSRRAA